MKRTDTIVASETVIVAQYLKLGFHPNSRRGLDLSKDEKIRASKAGEIMKMIAMNSDGQRYSTTASISEDSRTAPMYILTNFICLPIKF